MGSKHPYQDSSIEIAARSCDIASMDAVQQLALELKQMPRVAGGLKELKVIKEMNVPCE